MDEAGKGSMGRAIARQVLWTRLLWTTALGLAAALGVAHAKLEARHHAAQVAAPRTLCDMSSDPSAAARALPAAIYELPEAPTALRAVRGASTGPVRRVILVYEGSDANAWRAALRVPAERLKGARPGLSL
jgi:hypothetical protein